MKKGLVSAQEEARRIMKPCIDLSNECKELLPKMNITPRQGKLSRNEAAKAFKIIGKLLGKQTNIEYLRRDYSYGTYHGSRSLADLEMEAGV